jgi:hypothetical protein
MMSSKSNWHKNSQILVFFNSYETMTWGLNPDPRYPRKIPPAKPISKLKGQREKPQKAH